MIKVYRKTDTIRVEQFDSSDEIYVFKKLALERTE